MRIVALALASSLAAGALAQFDLPGLPRIPGLSEALRKSFATPPVFTTGMDDGVIGLTYLDDWLPEEFEEGRANLLREADRVDGQWRMGPGRYIADIQSFCGKGYSYGPTKGMGYIEAAWEGRHAALIQRVVDRYSAQDAITQRQAQVLIWGILAKTKPSKMQGEARVAALALLKPEEIAELESGALEYLNNRLMGELMKPVDRALKPLYDAENSVRRIVSSANQPYNELERLMVLEAPADSRTLVPRNRWTYHPNGFVMRFRPSGYRRMKLEIVVPHAPQIVRDELNRITRLETSPGWISEVEYNDEVMPVVHDELDAIAYPFKKVTLRAPDGEDGPRVHVVENEGWTFVQKRDTKLPALIASIGPRIQPGWFTRVRERAQRAREFRERQEEAQRQAERMNRILGGNASSDDFMDQGHYRDGLDTLRGSSGDRLGWIAEHHVRQSEALIFATNQIATLNPNGGVAQPAAGGHQRLLMSSQNY